MSHWTTNITSLQNPRVKEVIKLDKRSYRDERNIIVVEGFREVRRALENGRKPLEHFFCPELFQGENDAPLVEQSRQLGAEMFECTRAVFEKMAYRDRPEGHVVLFNQIHLTLDDLKLPPNPLLIVAEAIEKPGNLGSLLRSADAAGVHGVIVCDRCTDVHNPNCVRSSIGTLFSLPVVEASGEDALVWLRKSGIKILATTPHSKHEYTDVDMKGGVAIVVGTEKFGLSDRWMKEADLQVRIPMLGQIDSLNVSCATTILLYEAVRQRRLANPPPAV